MAGRARLESHGATISIDGHVIVEDVSLHVSPGEVLLVIGPSGSGKTTVLELLAGVKRPDAGNVLIDGTPVTRPGLVQMSFQQDPVYEHLDVEGNLGFPLDIRKTPTDERQSAVASTSRTMGIRKLLGRRPRHLSSGERAAVAVGRSLVRHPPYLLFDEPMAAADRPRRLTFLKRLRSLADEPEGPGIIVATNDPAGSIAIADRIAVLDSGRIIQTGRSQLVLERPASTDVASLVHDPPMNLIPASMEPGTGGTRLRVGLQALDLAEPGPVTARPLLLGAWSFELRLASPETPFSSTLQATVGRYEPVMGLVWFGVGRHATSSFAMAVRGGSGLEPGDHIELLVTGRRFFDAESGVLIDE